MTSMSTIVKRIKSGHGQIVTPVIDRWLVDHPEGVVMNDNITDRHGRTMSEVLVDITSSTANSQRAARFGASSRGTCERQQVFRFLGMPELGRMDPVLANLFNDGNWRHVRWQMMGLSAGVFDDVEVAGALPAYNVKVSLDGLNSKEALGFELKGASNFNYVVQHGVRPGHNLQIHTMMLVMGLDLFSYIVEDKRSQNWREIVVHRDEKIIREVKEELNAINDAIEDEVLPAVKPACRAKRGAEYKACPYRGECLGCDAWPTDSSWDA